LLYLYKGTLEKVLWDNPSAGPNLADYYYQRIDTQGNVYSVRYDGKNWVPQRNYRFSFALGDTSLASNATYPEYQMGTITKKNRPVGPSDTLGYSLLLERRYSPIRDQRTFSLGWGLFSIGGEGWSEELVGARVNGKTWGNLNYLTHVERDRPSEPCSIQLIGYPNPFNGSITLNIMIDKGTHSIIRIYNLLGQEISVLRSEYFDSGQHRVIWSPENVPSGIYTAVLSTGAKISMVKIVYLK
jgi:hypothetical protein